MAIPTPMQPFHRLDSLNTTGVFSSQTMNEQSNGLNNNAQLQQSPLSVLRCQVLQNKTEDAQIQNS